jgi:hypothetical protein
MVKGNPVGDVNGGEHKDKAEELREVLEKA